MYKEKVKIEDICRFTGLARKEVENIIELERAADF